jgi:threonine dehydratase
VRPEIQGDRRADERLRRHDALGAAGKRVTLADVGLFSDGTAVKLVGEETFRVARELVDDFVTVDTDAVCAPSRTCLSTRAASSSPPARWRGGHQAVRGQHKTKGETYAAITCAAPT